MKLIFEYFYCKDTLPIIKLFYKNTNKIQTRRTFILALNNSQFTTTNLFNFLN